MRKTVLTAILATVLLMVMTCNVGAASVPYYNYSFNFWGEPVEMPACYTVDQVLEGGSLGVGELDSPSDFFVGKDGRIYLVDSGNNRLLILDSSYRFLREINTLISEEGMSITTTFNNPSGVFVTDKGLIYLADTDNKRVVVFDDEGRYIKQFNKPSGNVQYTAVDYLPIRVVVDANDYVYVVSRNTYQGLILYDPSGHFEGYYAANETEVTFEVIADYMWKQLMTTEQRDKMANHVSIEYSSVDIDEQGFIYTTTLLTQTDTRQISRINPSGDDVMRSGASLHPDFAGKFGDLTEVQVEGTMVKTKFVDICYDELGFINALDYQRGRIFQYNLEGDAVTVFGGIGNQEGLFQSAAAIDMNGTDIVVLDSKKNSLTIFKQTNFGRTVHQAIECNREGEYETAKTMWETVRGQATNYTLALNGIGKAYYEQGDYEQAMIYYEQGQNREDYGRAWQIVRDANLRQAIPWVVLVVLVVVLVGFVLAMIRRIRTRKAEKGVRR